jgi:MerR family transcriptional regulator, mercuric resistance operon regulatory protein
VPGLTISGLARAGGVGVETVRYYQRRGLLETPDRPTDVGQSGSVRRYGSVDVRRLRFIRSAQRAGFTLQQIDELLSLDATHDRTRARELAHRRMEALDAKIAELKEAREALRRLAEQCGDCFDGPCPILVSFDDQPQLQVRCSDIDDAVGRAQRR